MGTHFSGEPAMPQTPDFSKLLSAGAEFVALTRAQARDRAAELVGQGQLAQSQVQGFVDDLVEESRRRTDTMMDIVRAEIGRQVKTLGIATKDDLAKLEAKLSASTRSAPPRRSRRRRRQLRRSRRRRSRRRRRQLRRRPRRHRRRRRPEPVFASTSRRRTGPPGPGLQPSPRGRDDRSRASDGGWCARDHSRPPGRAR